MTDSDPTPPPVTPLGYFERRVYRASGRFNLGGFLVALLGGLLAGVLSAGLVLAWMLFFAKDDLIFGYLAPIVGQGVIVGAVLFWLFRLGKVRNAPLALGIGLMCGLMSMVCFEAAVYGYSVKEQPVRTRLDLADQGIKPDSPIMQLSATNEWRRSRATADPREAR